MRVQRDVKRLEEISYRVENTLKHLQEKNSPTNRVMEDLLWLTQQVREAWLREEKLENLIEELREGGSHGAPEIG